MNIRSIHRINGLFLAVFVVLHMATHLSGVLGIETYNATQNALRLLYRNLVIEPILLMSFVVQIALGVRLVTQNFKRKMAEKWARAQAISGLTFLFFISQHLIAMSVTRWGDGLDTTFYWPASVMSGPPFFWYFAPYYFLGVAAMFVHLGCAARLHLMRRKSRNAARLAFWGIAIFGVAIAALIDLMLLGAFYDITIPDQWVGYLQKFLPTYLPTKE